MTRNIWVSALALGGALATGGAARADDARPLAPAGGTTMTLGGKGTAAQAATEDTERTGGYYRGYYGWGGGYGYRGYYGGWGGYYGGYRPYYGGWGGYYGYRPAYYSSFYYARPYYGGFYPTFPVYTTYYGYGSGFYLGIGGGLASGAPTVTLGESFARPPAVAPSMTPPTAPGDGTFQYDGGPINPVPLPKGEPQMSPPPAPSGATDLPISVKPKAAAPYRYKAYGEK